MLCWVILRAAARQRSALGHGPSVTGALVVFVEVGKSEGWRTECSGQPGEKCCSLDFCLLERYTKINTWTVKCGASRLKLSTDVSVFCPHATNQHSKAGASHQSLPWVSSGRTKGAGRLCPLLGAGLGKELPRTPLHHWQRQHPCNSSLRCLLSHCSQQ